MKSRYVRWSGIRETGRLRYLNQNWFGRQVIKDKTLTRQKWFRITPSRYQFICNRDIKPKILFAVYRQVVLGMTLVSKGISN